MSVALVAPGRKLYDVAQKPRVFFTTGNPSASFRSARPRPAKKGARKPRDKSLARGRGSVVSGETARVSSVSRNEPTKRKQQSYCHQPLGRGRGRVRARDMPLRPRRYCLRQSRHSSSRWLFRGALFSRSRKREQWAERGFSARLDDSTSRLAPLGSFRRAQCLARCSEICRRGRLTATRSSGLTSTSSSTNNERVRVGLGWEGSAIRNVVSEDSTVPLRGEGSKGRGAVISNSEACINFFYNSGHDN